MLRILIKWLESRCFKEHVSYIVVEEYVVWIAEKLLLYVITFVKVVIELGDTSGYIKLVNLRLYII